MTEQRSKTRSRVVGLVVVLVSTFAVGAHFRLGALSMSWPVFWNNFAGLLGAFFLVGLVGSFVFAGNADRLRDPHRNLGAVVARLPLGVILGHVVTVVILGGCLLFFGLSGL